jgi:hypothetical protein
MRLYNIIFLAICTLSFFSCQKVYTGYKFDVFNIDEIKLFSSKAEVVSKLNQPTMHIKHKFNLKLNNSKNLQDVVNKEQILECQTENCMYYMNAEGYDILFLRNIMQKYKTLILKFNKEDKLIEKYFLEN